MTVIIIFPFHISPSSSSYAPSSSAGIEEEEENFPPPFFSLFGYRSEKVPFPLPFFFAAALLEPQSTSNQSKSIILSAPPLSLLSGKRSHGNQRKAFFSELFFLFEAFMILRRRNSPAAKAKTLAAPERLSSIRPCLLSLEIQIQNEALFSFVCANPACLVFSTTLCQYTFPILAVHLMLSSSEEDSIDLARTGYYQEKKSPHVISRFEFSYIRFTCRPIEADCNSGFPSLWNSIG